MPASRLRSFLILGATVSGLYNSLNDMTLLSPSLLLSPHPNSAKPPPSPYTSDCLHVRLAALYTVSLALPTAPFKSSVTKYPDDSSWFSSHPKGDFAGSVSKLAAIASFHTLSNSLFTDNSIIAYKLRSAGCCPVGGSERRKCVTAEVFFSRS